MAKETKLIVYRPITNGWVVSISSAYEFFETRETTNNENITTTISTTEPLSNREKALVDWILLLKNDLNTEIKNLREKVEILEHRAKKRWF